MAERGGLISMRLAGWLAGWYEPGPLLCGIVLVVQPDLLSIVFCC